MTKLTARLYSKIWAVFALKSMFFGTSGSMFGASRAYTESEIGANRPTPKAHTGTSAILLWSFSLLLLAFPGCIVGPDFTGTPSPPLQLDFLAKQSLTNAPSIELSQWWTSFNDATLNELLNRAQAQNLTLREASERVIEARANFRLQGGQLAPNVNSVNEYSYLKRSPNSQPFVGSNGDPFNLLTLGFETSWEIDLFGRIARQIEAAGAEVQFQETDAESIRQTLFADIVASYLQIRLLQTQLALLEQNLMVQQHTAQLVNNRKEAGVSTELDKSQTASFGFRTETLFASLKQQLELEFNNLSLLMGQSPDFVLRDFVSIRPLPPSPAIPDVGFPADLLRRRPDVARQEQAVRAASALIGVAEADLYPQLSLLGNVAVSSQSLSGLFETDGLQFNVGPSLTWNIIHFGRIFNNIEIREAQFRQAVAAYQQSVLVAVREVEDAMVNHQGFVEQHQVITQAIEADEDAVYLSLQRYKAGKANFQRVIDAQQQLQNDQQLSYRLQTDAMTQLVRLYKAAGGDWAVGQSIPIASEVFIEPHVDVEVPLPQPVVHTFQPQDAVHTLPPQGGVTFEQPSGYPLQFSTDPLTLSNADSPFDPTATQNQSILTNPAPPTAEPLNDFQGLPTQQSSENWLWDQQ